ncbi:MAG TPA: DUF3575 domain-containing protein [Dysgonomonas sp.]|nr:DUF3575 domain-containing protein [Dysgonomonas sp.]
MKKVIFILISIAVSASLFSQDAAIKNNLLYDATLTPNLGLEFRTGMKNTLDVNVGFNPFTFSEGKKLKHWLVQPELRFWTCEAFNGTFIGVHAHGGEFSVANFKMPFGWLEQLQNYRYEGYFVGGGISVGHQWILSKRWTFEASIGAGYAFIEYDKYPCPDCGPKIKSDTYNYWGITKATLSFVYFIF